MSLADLSSKLKRLDSLYSNNPKLFCVFDTDLVPIDASRSYDFKIEDVWFDESGTEPFIYDDDELFDALDLVSNGGDEVVIDDVEYSKLEMACVPKLISVFFTVEAAQKFIDGGRHEFRKPYIEAITIDRRNAEMLEVRSLIANTF